MIDYQPLIQAAAAFAGFFLWPWLMALWLFGVIVQRSPKLAGWIEALGWQGIRELLAGFGNSPAALLRAQADAKTDEPGNVTTLVRP